MLFGRHCTGAWLASLCSAASQRQALVVSLGSDLQHMNKVITYSAVISACEKCGRWQEALLVLVDMQRPEAPGVSCAV